MILGLRFLFEVTKNFFVIIGGGYGNYSISNKKIIEI